jgi:hypothetical protein
LANIDKRIGKSRMVINHRDCGDARRVKKLRRAVNRCKSAACHTGRWRPIQGLTGGR